MRSSRGIPPATIVAMIGFTPGWSYLSGPRRFTHMPRRQNPRLLTPAGHGVDGGVQIGVQARRPALASARTNLVRTYQPTVTRSSCWSPATPLPSRPSDAKTFAEQDRAAEAGEFIAELISPRASSSSHRSVRRVRCRTAAGPARSAMA